jgi:tetratricopeptide (TPR) repeat protein
MTSGVTLIENPLAHVTLGPRLATAVVVLWEYLALLTVPIVLSADYSFNQVPVVTSPFDPRFLGALAVLTSLVAIAAWSRPRAPVLGFALLFGALSMTLTANLLFPIGAIKAERLLYLPSVGWCLAVGWLIVTWSRDRKLVAASVLVVVVLGFATRTWARNPDWRNNLALFEAAVQATPRSFKAQRNLASVYRNAKQVDQAIVHYHEALAIRPEAADVATELGEAYEFTGATDLALAWYRKAVTLDPRIAWPYFWSGNLRARRGDYARAERDFRAGLVRDQNHLHLLAGLALVRLAQGDPVEARTLIERGEGLATTDASGRAAIAQARAKLDGVAARAGASTGHAR